MADLKVYRFTIGSGPLSCLVVAESLDEAVKAFERDGDSNRMAHDAAHVRSIEVVDPGTEVIVSGR